MPIYEYACAKCESEFEAEQRITDDPLKSCPRCRSRRVKRLISQTSFALKGGGWYADGYASKGGEKASEKKSTGEKSESADASKSSTSKDSSQNKTGGGSKPAAKGKKAVA
jgi:putative FmdB family regulatory protein